MKATAKKKNQAGMV